MEREATIPFQTRRRSVLKKGHRGRRSRGPHSLVFLLPSLRPCRDDLVGHVPVGLVAAFRQFSSSQMRYVRSRIPLFDIGQLASLLFHAGRHLCHGHQRLGNLIEQLARILLFSQRGCEELDQERLAKLKR